MLLVRDHPDGTQIVLGRRAMRDNDPWSGHIALPGGRLAGVDEQPLAAAVRETIEEVGIDPRREGRILGSLGLVFGRGMAVPVAAYAAIITSGVEPAATDEFTAAWWASIDAYKRRWATVAELPEPVPALIGTGPDGSVITVWGMTYRVLSLARTLVGSSKTLA
jgi:8-oxo-dGTP pyrophosphatase MutT (NUDIX family)